MEHVPAEKNEQGVENIETWPPDEVFQHLAGLYIKYIDIYRKLEECYDQMVHPQKRIFIKKTLECTICRICEMKKDLVLFNPRPASIYVHLDQLLFDLKYDPSMIEIPVPRYFKEDDRIPMEIEFKEKVEKDDGGKKKKKKKGGGRQKKKKKTDDDDDKKKEVAMPIAEKSSLMDQLLDQYKGYHEPEIEVIQDPFTLDIDIVQAIRIIQKNDRGRQGISRVTLMIKHIAKAQMDIDIQRKAKEGKMKRETDENKENNACVFLQRRIRGILARKFVERLRADEMEFLGMQRKKKTPEEERNDPIKKMEQTRAERKLV